ncbi:MAG: thioredoxin domain-containing protein [Anaerolineae bacterium]|nr:thioredoxin domain-containing protein [Anaerolineae bacterium]
MLFEAQDRWASNEGAVQVFVDMAGELGLDEGQFEACLTDGEFADEVRADLAAGQAAGITGTPGFLINGALLSGAQPFSAFQQQIDYYLAGGQAPIMEVAADSFRSMGDADAPVVVTEFSDYGCPACGQVEQIVIPEMIERYVDTGMVRFVYRQFPLESLHPNAPAASRAAYCAGQQGGYWEMHGSLFANKDQWNGSDDPITLFAQYASDLGLNPTALTACIDSDEAKVFVQSDMLAGQEMGVNATPYFFVGDLPIRGGLPIEQLGQVIEYVADGGPPPNILPQTQGDWRVQGNPMGGTANAITIAFLNYADPESANHVLKVWPQLKETYIDPGQLVYVVHPLFGEADSPAAEATTAALCAGRQDSFLAMHTFLFENQEAWTAATDVDSTLVEYAGSLGLDQAQFESCLTSDEARLEARSGNVVAALYGVPGSPVFLFNNGQGEQGSVSFEDFQTIIESITGQ